MLVFLVILTATFFLLTFYSILQTNLNFLPIELGSFLSFKILDTSTAATLFVTLLGALVVRHQFALSLHPRINYKSASTKRNESTDPALSFRTWRVELRNSGLGAAVIISAKYALALADSTSNPLIGTYRDIIEALAAIGLVREQDYWMENIATGFAVSSKDDCFVFEIRMEHKAKIKRLDMMLLFQDQLGGKYQRELFLIPRHSVDLEK